MNKILNKESFRCTLNLLVSFDEVMRAQHRRLIEDQRIFCKRIMKRSPHPRTLQTERPDPQRA